MQKKSGIKFSDSSKERYNFWIEHKDIDEKDKLKLYSLSDKEIEDLFSYELEFGTGGMRGIMGLGSDRLNKYTVAKASIGISRYLLDKEKNPSVVIAYDSRNNSREFAGTAAECFSSFGIKVYMFSELRPTPELSFAIRRLEASCGIMITASHNPKEYNGYKVYQSDGCQITHPVDLNMISYIKKENHMKPNNIKKELINYLYEDMDLAYLDQVKKQSIKTWTSDLKIVYSPLNGTGGTLIPGLLTDLGYKVFTVDEQIEADSNFPTVPKPNPENPEVYDLGIKLAKKVDADIVICTDPDADRMGCFCRLKKGQYHRLTGNVSGAVIGKYILEHRAKDFIEEGKKPCIIKTIVSSKLIEKIAFSYGAEVKNVLTGFKYIGNLMNKCDFIYGMEESYGCLAGDYARDKDGVLACLLISELMGYLKEKKLSMHDYIKEIYDEFGYLCDDIKTIEFPSNKGKQIMNAVLDRFRKVDISEKINFDILNRIDYLNDDTGLPKSDVLFYELDFGWFCIRRSGTEPKLKIYFEANSDNNLEMLMNSIENFLVNLTKEIKNEIG